jgi:hypothetical protein
MPFILFYHISNVVNSTFIIHFRNLGWVRNRGHAPDLRLRLHERGLEPQELHSLRLLLRLPLAHDPCLFLLQLHCQGRLGPRGGPQVTSPKDERGISTIEPGTCFILLYIVLEIIDSKLTTIRFTDLDNLVKLAYGSFFQNFYWICL